MHFNGRPNMTSKTFCTWVNKQLLSSRHLLPHYSRCVSFCTAVCCLHHLGFMLVSHKKGVCIDGYVREDVLSIMRYIYMLIDYLNNISLQQEYLKTKATLQQSHKLPPACSNEPPRVYQEEDDEKRILIVLYHDQSIYNSKGQTWMREEEDKLALLSKMKGSGIMVFDFLDEHGGYLCLSSQQNQQSRTLNPEIA